MPSELPVQWVPDSAVVNGGDFLQLLSNGTLHSPIHRVTCPPADSDRLSYVFFYYPKYDSTSSQFSRLDTHSHSQLHSQLHSQRTAEVDIEGQIQASAASNNPSTVAYNTLLSGVDGEDEGAFGDYILHKWRGVSREG